MRYAVEGLSFVISLAGNIFLAGFFFISLLNPQNAEFLFRTGMLIFFVEFLSIHSSGMAFGARKKERGDDDAKVIFRFSARGVGKNILQSNPKATLMVFYALFVLVLGLVFKNLYLPFYFFISLVIKFFGKNALKDKLRVGIPLLLFVASTLFAVLTTPFLVKIFPLPNGFFQYRLSGSSGYFVEYPQSLMVWGVVYFFSLCVAEAWLFSKKVRQQAHISEAS